MINNITIKDVATACAECYTHVFYKDSVRVNPGRLVRYLIERFKNDGLDEKSLAYVILLGIEEYHNQQQDYDYDVMLGGGEKND